MDTRYVIGLGEILWDVFPSGKKLGGAPANFAYHAAQLGHDALVVSAVGYDRDGSGIIQELESSHYSTPPPRAMYRLMSA